MTHPPALFSGDLDIEAHSEAAEVRRRSLPARRAADAPDPHADKWLDNLSEAKLVHKGLLPVVIKPSAAPKSTGDAS